MPSPETPTPGQPDPAALLALGLATQATDAGASSPPPLTPAELAAEFPQLEIIELLGRGGMGAVYKARQRDLDRLVALKILRSDLDADPGFAGRFAREARALAQLNHPGIVTLYEFGKTSVGRYFILMEFVDGVNLRQLLAAGRLAPREALAIVPPLCDALQYAHDRGLVHRDIKPENLLIDRLGRVKIADFGIARLASGSSEGRDGTPSRPSENASEILTSAGEVMGTPHYMAPEQRDRPAEVDHRADLYALGVVLYQMLTGELPAAGQLQAPSTRVRLDVRLDEIVLRALERDPARRYAAATEFKTQIETLTANPGPPPTTPASPSSPASSLPRRSFSPWLLVLLFCAAYLGSLALSADQLPSRVASHFNANGVADAWMPRADYLLFIGILPCALAALLALVGCTLRWLPAHAINIPHRDHWLAPARKADTAALFLRWMAGPACLLLALFAQIHLVTVLLANQNAPAQLPAGLLIGPAIGFLIGLMVCILGLVLRFAEPDASPAKLRRQTWLLLGIGLLAIVSPSIPLLTRAASLLNPALTATTSDTRAWNLDVVVTDHRAWPPKTLPPERALPVAGAALALLGSCDARQPGTLEDWKTADAGPHLRLEYPRASEGKMPDAIVIPLPLGSGVIWTRKAKTITRHSKFLPAKAEELARQIPSAGLPALTPESSTTLIQWIEQATITLEKVDEGDYRSLWKEASSGFRSATTQDAWEETLQKTRGPLGTVAHREIDSSYDTATLPGAPAGRYIVLQFWTVFGNGQTAIETLTYKENSARERQLEGYRIHSHTKEERQAVYSANICLNDIDNGHYELSWDRASEAFRNALPRRQWRASLESARRPLGKVVFRMPTQTHTATRLPGVPDGRYISITFATAFTEKENAVETMTLRQESDGEWRLAGYYIR